MIIFLKECSFQISTFLLIFVFLFLVSHLIGCLHFICDREAWSLIRVAQYRVLLIDKLSIRNKFHRSICPLNKWIFTFFSRSFGNWARRLGLQTAVVRWQLTGKRCLNIVLRKLLIPALWSVSFQIVCNAGPWARLFALVWKEIYRRSWNSAALIYILNLFNICDKRHRLLTIVDASIYSISDTHAWNLLIRIMITDTRPKIGGFLRADYLNNMLRMLFFLLKIKLLQVFVKLVYVGQWLIHDGFAIIFA